jgi:hypothetical protein
MSDLVWLSVLCSGPPPPVMSLRVWFMQVSFILPEFIDPCCECAQVVYWRENEPRAHKCA